MVEPTAGEGRVRRPVAFLVLVLALLVTPVTYSLIDSLSNRIRRLFGRPPVRYIEAPESSV